MLDSGIAKPLPLFSARAVLPCIMHAQLDGIGAGLPQFFEDGIGAAKAALASHRIGGSRNSNLVHAHAIGTVSHDQLHPANGVPFKSLETLESRSCNGAADMRIGRVCKRSTHDPRVWPNGTLPCAREVFGNDEFDRLAAFSLKFDIWIAGQKRVELEQ